MNLLNTIRLLYSPKPFFAWQVELTTRCQLKCKMCIKKGSANWQARDIKIEDFRKISEYFSKTENIVLQGWGEPLLYGNLIDAVRIVKEKGSHPGFVTSGSTFEGKLLTELIDAGMDFIGFSLAGATAQTHASIRINSDFEFLLENIRFLNALKKEKKINKPLMHIVYLMLKDNIAEVPALVELAGRIGISNIILTNLIHVSNEWQEKQRVFTCEKGGSEKGHNEILKSAEIKAKKLNINLSIPCLSPASVPVCGENPLKNLYISAEGEVSPCVYLYPPVPAPFKRIYCGSKVEIEKISFGNILREPFNKIWSSNKYAEFRRCFEKRLKGYNRLSPANVGKEPPVQCKTCHKILGL